MNDLKSILKKLRSHANPKNAAGMARFGINPKNTLGVSIPTLRQLAKKIGKNHKLAQQLWKSGVHEARLLAGFIDEPAQVTSRQMEGWVRDFDSWDICDQVCMSLFDKTAWAWQKAVAWSKKKEEFVKRAGFAMMATLAVHDKKAADIKFLYFFPLIKDGSTDERNFVRKAVNWALRQIGKRNQVLGTEAIRTAKEIAKLQSKAAKWVAADALRELSNRVK
jgi:3-methyladenine DNA glycosylase AlkD